MNHLLLMSALGAIDPSAAIDWISAGQVAVGVVGAAWLLFRSLGRLWGRMITKDPAR